MAILNFDAYWRDHGVAKGLKTTSTQAKEAEGHVTGVAKAGSSLGKAFAVFAAAEIFHSFIEGARESNMVSRITEQRIRSTGGAAHVTAGEVADLGRSISEKTGADHVAIQSGENMLLTFTKVRNETGKGNDIFNQATMAVTDLAAGLNHGEVSADGTQHAAIMLGKALQDPIKGLGLLGRAGIVFTEQQKAQITTLVKSGHTLEAQKIIIGEVNREFGGTAAAAADPLQRMSVIVKDLGEEVGQKMLPALNAAADVMAAIPGPVYMVVGGLAALGVAAIGVAKGIEAVKAVHEATTAVMKLFTVRVAEAAAAEGAEAVAADGAAVSTAAAGDSAAVAGTKFSGLAGKLGIGAAVVGMAAVSAEATSWLGKAEVTKVQTGALADAFLHMGDSTRAPKAAIDAVSTSADEWYGKVQSSQDVMRQFGALAQGAFSMSWDNIIGRAQSGSERLDRFNQTAKQMDDALAQMVQSGHGAEASVMFEALLQATGLAGAELDHVRNRFGQYRAAAQAAAVQSDATAAAIGDTNSVLLGVQHGANMAATALTGITASQHAAAVASQVHGESLRALLDEYPNYQKEVLRAAGATTAAKAETVLLTAAQVKNIRSTMDAKVALDLLTQSLQANNNMTLSLMGGEDGWYSALQSVTDAVKTNGRTLDVHTAKGRANRQALEGLASAGLNYLDVIQKNNGVGPLFRRTLDQQWQKLYEAGRRFGDTRAQARAYANQILAVPKALATRVTTPGMAAARAAVQNLHRDINNLSNRTIKIVVNSDGTFTQGTRKGRARGGAIEGSSPSATADNIPIAATAGEHMWSVAEVQGAGGHGSVEALRSMARAGTLPRFAAGGSITLRGSAHLPSAQTLDAVMDAKMMAAYKGAMTSGGGPLPGGSGVARWGPMVHRALAILGLAGDPFVFGRVMRQINTESGGNPNATQGNIGDVNNRSGDLARGLMQVIGATFRAYHWPGTSWSQYDPWASIMAGLNYARHRYGPSLYALGNGHGYAAGTRSAAPGWSWVGERGPELVKFRGGEQVVPYQRGSGGGQTVIVNQTFNLPNYIGDKNDLIRSLGVLSRQGRLDHLLRRAN